MPMNIDLLNLKPRDLEHLERVSVLDTLEGVTKNFHPKGLFSTEIFGRVGDPKRTSSFAYIKLGTGVFHPLYFKLLTKLSTFYHGIISGKEYALFDKESEDFVKSNEVEGETGFTFFLKHFPNLKLTEDKNNPEEEKGSVRRETYVNLIEKYRERSILNEILVLPAGLRDLEIDKNGKMSENEINDLYRKVITYSNLLYNIKGAKNTDHLDNIKYNLQIAILSLYEYIKEIVNGDGKHGFIQSKWASRKIYNSTRNVITSFTQPFNSCDDPKAVHPEQTVAGLYQSLRVIFPLSFNLVKDEFLDKVFINQNGTAVVVDAKTLKKKTVQVKTKTQDGFMTPDGLEKQFANFKNEGVRHSEVMVQDYYLGLIFSNEDSYRFVQDIDDVPEELLKTGSVQPITYAELFSLSIYKRVSDYPVFVTRFPVANYGSIYPSYTYLKTTVVSQVKKELGEDWQPTGNVFYEYPVKGEKFFDSLAVNHMHLGRLGADFDGDKVSFTAVMSNEAMDEIKKKMSSKEYYVDVNNKVLFSADSDITEVTLSTLTY